MPVHIVLLNPEIPNNTGTIGRTAAATGAVLHVVHPITFDMSEKARRRAGLDYWDQIDCREHENWQAFLDAEQPERLWAMTARADRPVWEASIQRGDYLLFGCETRGLPEAIQAWAISRWGHADFTKLISHRGHSFPKLLAYGVTRCATRLTLLFCLLRARRVRIARFAASSLITARSRRG